MNTDHLPSRSVPPRKPYAKPQLICYGHVTDIVRGGGGNMCDATGNNTHSCWIAEVLYGVDAPERS